ncbi:hypothetical protein LSS_21505 [Leptospira santarosai serovar Shermani str. LT 821]|uniref:Uncharacterized protein n=1 Tax=Leptospira santarosai serovar Shermani str. LT 821 TaxID=758847 RepID=A0A097ESK6_9LEPT|nr:hypothetical protein LSS_21505 [Leptospira santarosai serovar Shermani str. LT 821]
MNTAGNFPAAFPNLERFSSKNQDYGVQYGFYIKQIFSFFDLTELHSFPIMIFRICG